MCFILFWNDLFVQLVFVLIFKNKNKLEIGTSGDIFMLDNSYKDLMCTRGEGWWIGENYLLIIE